MPPGCTAARGGRSPAASQPGETRSEARRLLDQAAGLQFSTERADLLGQVAARPDLTGPEQIDLIDAAYGLGYGENIASVLTTLARNPALTDEARTHLRENLDRIPFSNYRQQVLDALGG